MRSVEERAEDLAEVRKTRLPDADFFVQPLVNALDRVRALLGEGLAELIDHVAEDGTDDDGEMGRAARAEYQLLVAEVAHRVGNFAAVSTLDGDGATAYNCAHGLITTMTASWRTGPVTFCDDHATWEGEIYPT